MKNSILLLAILLTICFSCHVPEEFGPVNYSYLYFQDFGLNDNSIIVRYKDGSKNDFLQCEIINDSVTRKLIYTTTNNVSQSRICRIDSSLFYTADGVLYKVKLSTGIEQQLYNFGSFFVEFFDFSSNYEKLIILSDLNNNYDIYTINYDGTNFINLTNDTIIEDYPEFSQDDTKIVYCADYRNIYVMNSDGTNKSNISNLPLSSNEALSNPTFSNDGTKILYYKYINWGSAYLSLMNIDGSNKIDLTDSTYYPLGNFSWTNENKIFFLDGFNYYAKSFLISINPITITQTNFCDINFYSYNYRFNRRNDYLIYIGGFTSGNIYLCVNQNQKFLMAKEKL